MRLSWVAVLLLLQTGLGSAEQIKTEVLRTLVKDLNASEPPQGSFL